MGSERPRRAAPESRDQLRFRGLPVLDRFSPPFVPGAMSGSGSQNLLGRPAASKEVTLVRETAQNSWDAMDPDIRHVEFEMHVRSATPEMLEVLRESVFADPGSAESLGLAEALDRPELWVLEISDRGTVGLGGPTRNDVVEAGSNTNYADFVLTVGAPRDVHLGGGTYGFGKSISYAASESSTVVIWTSCDVEGHLEQRLIASAMGRGFSEDGVKHTGRHWWGRAREQHVEPLVGDDAEAVGTILFAKGFESGVRGTSLLVIAPEMGESPSGGQSTPREYAERLSQAAADNLWPKLVHDGDRSQMTISVLFEGEDLSPQPVELDPVLQHYATSLNLVRAMQRGENPSSLMSETWVVEDGRSHRVVGHMAATRYLETEEVRARHESLYPGDGSGRGHHLCLMRHQAELVVQYQAHKPGSVEDYSWAAVFKPVAATDDAFADSEPPSHDAWSHAGLSNADHKAVVRLALNKTRQLLDAWSRPSNLPPRAVAGNQSPAALADHLGALVVGGQGGAPRKRAGTGGKRGKRKAQPGRVRVVSHVAAPHQSPDFSQWELEVVLEGDQPARVEARPAIHTLDTSENDSDLCATEGWLIDGALHRGSVATLVPGKPARVFLRVASGLAIDAKWKVEPCRS